MARPQAQARAKARDLARERLIAFAVSASALTLLAVGLKLLSALL